MRAAILMTACLATACSSIPKMPETVPVAVEKLVPVPAALTKPCDEIEKRAETYGEAIRLANTRKASLQECNARMAEIRRLGEPVK